MNRDILNRLDEAFIQNLLQEVENLKLSNPRIFQPVKSNQADKLHIQVDERADTENAYIMIADLTIMIEDALLCKTIVLLKSTLQEEAKPQIIGRMVDVKLENLADIKQLLLEQCGQWENFQRSQQQRFTHFQPAPTIQQPSQSKPEMDLDHLYNIIKQAVENDEYAKQCLRENPAALKETLTLCINKLVPSSSTTYSENHQRT